MVGRKKFFPKNASHSSTRGRARPRSTNRYDLSKSYGNGRNLRIEFDRLVREKHTLISEDQLQYLWNIISMRLVGNPHAPLEEQIQLLDITP